MREKPYSVIAKLAFQSSSTEEILRQLAVMHIPVVVLKGMAYLDKLYSSSEMREMYDVDLLVRWGEFDHAESVLRELGYAFSEEGLGCTAVFTREFMGEVPYRKGAMVVDLHWHLVAPQWYRRATAFDLDGIWSRAVSMTVGDAPALRLCPEDELIHLCYHTAVHHGLAHRQGYEDIIRVARAEAANLDWEVLAQRARTWRVSAACWAALSVAREKGSGGEGGGISAETLAGLGVPQWRQALLRPFVRQAAGGRPALVSGKMRFLGVLLIDRLRDLPGVLWHGLFPGRRWLQTRFDLSPRQTRWRQVTYPLEVVWRSVRALLARR